MRFRSQRGGISSAMWLGFLSDMLVNEACLHVVLVYELLFGCAGVVAAEEGLG